MIMTYMIKAMMLAVCPDNEGQEFDSLFIVGEIRGKSDRKSLGARGVE